MAAKANEAEEKEPVDEFFDTGVTLSLDTSEGEWFDFFTSYVDQNSGEIVYHDPNPAAKALIRSAAPFIEEQVKKRKRKTEHIYNPKTRSMERVTGFEDPSVDQMMKEADDVFDYSIIDFQGFKDRKTGKMIACNRENKTALRRNQVFQRFFERCQQILNGSAEAIEKN